MLVFQKRGNLEVNLDSTGSSKMGSNKASKLKELFELFNQEKISTRFTELFLMQYEIVA